MNFLAHLHIADVSNTSLVGNLLGDFVRGDPTGKYQEDWVEGIRIHRFVDSYTDNHPDIKAILPLFGQQRRFAPIALDVHWDHCLITHWDRFHSKGFKQFCRSVSSHTHPKHVSGDLPERYSRVVSSMWDGEWFESYRDMDNIGYALMRMSKRSPRMAPLALCHQHLVEHYDELEQVFLRFYPELIEAVSKIK
ncbi:acyl carrier protein phosphodiesterase [Vibrio ishigakensis]|uniref:Acyl carrier protein phosphodiesterase n=1 Tax=Vibrio ishigakensis TaxID=1481914 RepID=A0A0B8P1M0_9VIBR|nr:ACP phosphodiesterase [Vibrio ishigakensis]GAM58447.1 acyl carrier protein phosphodiesterase [Vibrio ishigakensis]